MSCPKWTGSPRPPVSFQILKRSLKRKSIKDFTTVAHREEFLLQYWREERRRKEEVCWNLLLVPTVVRPDRHRRTSHDHLPREIVSLRRWPTQIYKSSVRASRHLPQLCKRQGQEGDYVGGEWVETFTRGSERMAATQPPPSPPQRSNPPPQD
jgi:hypothetical protein